MSTHVWSEAVCIGSGVYVPMHEAERVITELENKVDTNYQTIAPEVGKDNPGTARLMADIQNAEDVVDPRSAAPSVTVPCRARGKWSALGSGATPDLCFPCGDTSPFRTMKANPDGTYTDPRKGDEDVRPDPYDGGCPADCGPSAEYVARMDECSGNAQMLRGMGYASAADVLRDRAGALVRRISQ